MVLVPMTLFFDPDGKTLSFLEAVKIAIDVAGFKPAFSLAGSCRD